MGEIKVSAGTIITDPEDPNKCILTTLDKAKMKYVPNFVIKKVMSKAVSEVDKMFTNYLKSQTYANLQAQQQ